MKNEIQIISLANILAYLTYEQASWKVKREEKGESFLNSLSPEGMFTRYGSPTPQRKIAPSPLMGRANEKRDKIPQATFLQTKVFPFIFKIYLEPLEFWT